MRTLNLYKKILITNNQISNFVSLKLYSILFLPFLLASTAVSRVETHVETSGEGNVIIENSAKAEANGQSVEVHSQEPGKIEAKIENGEVSVQKSPSSQPTIIITLGPTPEVKLEAKELKEEQASLSKIINNRTSSIYCFLRGLFLRLIKPFRFKT